jgi:choline dehydrogenase
VIAGRLAEAGQEVLLLEAGPDYGPRNSGRWPDDLLDAATLAMASHDWGYSGQIHGREIAFPRAKVLGGCSSHNAGAVVHGSRFDYDGWAALGNPGWSTNDLLPLFDKAWERLRVRRVGFDELTPFQAEFAGSLEAVGIPRVDDINDLDEVAGVAPYPLSVEPDGKRITAPFAYLDHLRGEPNLTIVGDAEVERLLLEGSRATGVVVRHDGADVEVRAERVVLSAGAYGSPAILLRSGIGAAPHLRAAGVQPVRELPGVGENLHDQPALEFDYAGSRELVELMSEYSSDRWRPDEQVIAKLPSHDCGEGFDLHIYALGGRNPYARESWRWTLAGVVVSPLSRGHVRLSGPHCADPLIIDHGYLTDADGSDLERLVEASLVSREAAAQPRFKELLGKELVPGPEVEGEDDLRDFARQAAVHYFHPAGSCKMGPASDPTAVVGADASVHGVEGAYVADASIMPFVMSGNTNMPTTVIGEKVAELLSQRRLQAPD